jgi:antibiotic biosynthesis monooxygenase (ABM) superfamily enzyme
MTTLTTLTDKTIGVVATRRVPAANWEAFEIALRELRQIASKQPGQVACDVLRGAVRGSEREYFVVYRFADETSLRAWDDSPERRALVARVDALSIGGRRRELTGLEAWFDLPPGQLPPPRHRMAFVTWLGIWPLVSLALWLLAPFLVALPFLLRTGTLSALIVLTMTYLVMPQLAKLAEPWLRTDAGREGASS